MTIINEINQELRRLKVSRDNDLYTGLRPSLDPADYDVVTLYDHWDASSYDTSALLDHLRTMESASMGDMSRSNNIWTQIIHLELEY